MTQRVSVDELQARLGDCLERARGGEEVTVIHGDEVIARILPPRRSGPSPERYREMVEAGIIRPGRRDYPDDILDEPLDLDPDDSVLEALLEERATGR